MTARHWAPGRRAFLGMTAAAAVTLPHLALGQGLSADAAPLDRIEGRAFGTTWWVLASADQGLRRLQPDIARRLARVDEQMSPWRADSEITGVNRHPAGRHRVSGDTATVCEAALGIARASDGWFDPTVGPVLARWGFGPIEGDAGSDWRDLRVAGGDIEKARDGVTFDLCGIAKGWALDRMAAALREAGIDAALIDLGGELRALGQHPSGRPWQVAVEDPRGAGGVAAVLGLGDLAVATSGLRQQSYALGGRTYGHIVDPRTGAPATGALRSVSVVAPDAMMADGWATALFAAGAQAGPDLARDQDLAALFLSEIDGELRPQMTGGFAEVVL